VKLFSLVFDADRVQYLRCSFAVGFLCISVRLAIEARPPNREVRFPPCARGQNIALGNETFRAQTRSSGWQVFATSRCARRDGAGALRVPDACVRACIRSQRVKATHGEVRNSAFPRFKEWVSGHSDRATALSRGFFVPQNFAGKLPSARFLW